MWEELKNKTDLWRDGNASLKAVSEQPWFVTDALYNGSTANPQAPGTDPDSVSGIIPGSIAAAVFISFLLALYAILWKCMVTAPKRKERKRGRAREQRDHVC
ncbi:hypothetical protein SKAU_G00000200 [Synaphobranchus kaupii]|uniref:Uncharacterized protein n=1 Tax=Synaphobranchus kaupii TaxID=118154 RepID=A0A9Q1JCC8_SYNKA|nr:hypothetical protein SKAU_G00000200 [Synaphobranchus kaupii]